MTNQFAQYSTQIVFDEDQIYFAMFWRDTLYASESYEALTDQMNVCAGDWAEITPPRRQYSKEQIDEMLQNANATKMEIL